MLFRSKDFGAIWSQATRLQAVSVTIASVVWGLIVENMGYAGGMWVSFALFVVALLLGLKSLTDAKGMRERWTE